jgi:tetratricopeptide (TPR) repeat protein
MDIGGTRQLEPATGSLRARPRGPARARAAAFLAAILLIAVLGAGLVGAEHHRKQAPARVAAPDPARAPQARPVVQSGTLAQTIAGLQARIRTVPQDWNALASLGLAYVQEARITADPTYYPKAQAVLDRSMAVHSDGNFDAMVGLAALAAARHDFSLALSWGRKAVGVNPYNGGVHDVVGDALIELGRYHQAFRELQKAVDLRPDLSSYARASYARELQGDVAGAIAIMRDAYGSAGTLQDMAWTLNQLGDLYFNSGRLDPAEENYRKAIAADPTFVPPHAGLARVAAARGQTSAAISGFQWVVTRFPLPEYVIALGDLDQAAGRPSDAERQYGLVHVEEQLFAANGVNVDLEISLFDADHRVDLAAGLAAAQAEWGRRQSIHVADALGWELYANGRPAEALPFANRALALGTKNALFFFHRGMIERALGRHAAERRDLARALAINPHFSILWSGPATAILATMGGAP